MSEIGTRDLKWLFFVLHQILARENEWTPAKTMDWITSDEGQRKLRYALQGLTLHTNDPSRRQFYKRIFGGAGIETLKKVRTLHERLDYGLNMLGGLQQEGLMGTNYDAGAVAIGEQEIQKVVTDIEMALTGHERLMPQPFTDLREWWAGNDLFIAEMIETLIENETDEKKGFTFQEIRDLMEAKYDEDYDSDVRDIAPIPTQRQVNLAVEVLLLEEGGQVAYEKDDHIYLHHDELEERRITNDILAHLKGK